VLRDKRFGNGTKWSGHGISGPVLRQEFPGIGSVMSNRLVQMLVRGDVAWK
jgi:hypothetical protein